MRNGQPRLAFQESSLSSSPREDECPLHQIFIPHVPYTPVATPKQVWSEIQVSRDLYLQSRGLVTHQQKSVRRENEQGTINSILKATNEAGEMTQQTHHPHDGSQQPIALALGDQMPSFGPCRLHTNRQMHTHIHFKKMKGNAFSNTQ